MSDETIQYITTDYLIEVDGGEPTPTPIEYIVELGQVGVQGIPGEKGEPGFSPTVGYILNDNTFKINITNQDGVTQTPNLYDYFADKNGYLKKDGSNAKQNITINQAEFISLANNSGVRIRNKNGRGALQLSPDTTYLQTGSYGMLASYSNNLVSFGNVNGTAKVIQATADKVYYEAYTSSPSDSNREIATIGDIPTVSDATITLTQGGVPKGTFTLNGSETTIDLDAGGGSITNPLEIVSSNGNQSIFLGFDGNTSKVLFQEQLRTSGSSFTIPLHAISGADNPIAITKNNDTGLSRISLKIDDTTIKVNQDGQLYAIGGGTTYTAGTGIDITGGVISIDTSVVAQLSDIPDTSDMATKTWVGNQGYLTSITSGDVTTALGYTPYDSSNPNGYTNNVGTVTSVNNTSPDSNGNVTLSIPSTTYMVTTNTQQTITADKIFDDSGILFYDEVNNTNRNGITYNEGVGVYVGDTGESLLLQGSSTHPYYNNNTLALSSEIPSNSDYVDLSTAQSISGVKTFNDSIKLNGAKYLQYTNGSQTVNLIGTNNSALGSGNILVGNGSDYLMLHGKDTRPQYKKGSDTPVDVALYSDIPSLTNYVTNTDYATTSVGGVVKVDSSTITIDANGVISATSDSNKADKDLSNVTTTGKSTSVGWAMPKTGGRTQLFTPSDNMNGVNFTNTTGKNGYLFVASDTSASGNHILYVKNESAQLESTAYGSNGIVIEAFVPVAIGQTCQFFYLDFAGTGGYTVYFVEAIGG